MRCRRLLNLESKLLQELIMLDVLVHRLADELCALFAVLLLPLLILLLLGFGFL
jgi:hypothetical protein